MSEEILKALTQLFAIISKQDGGVTEGERQFVIRFFKQDLDSQTMTEYLELYDKHAEYGLVKDESDEAKKKKKRKLTSVRDSVRTLALCRRINKTLTQRQKVIVLVKLLEMLAADRKFTPQRMEIIKTVSEVFNIDSEEYHLLEKFAIEEHSSKLDDENILIFDDEMPAEGSKIKFIDSGLLDGEIIFAHVNSVELYFTKYTGHDEIFLNNQQVRKGSILLFSPGSVFRTPKGEPLYYSDLVTTYNAGYNQVNISFNATDLEFKFPNGALGLRNIQLSEGPGKLISIMGASGAGKTTLLNVLAGLYKPSQGAVTINGVDIHKNPEDIEGVIGYISQDDLLIEELTVYQNLYYNAKLCFRDLSEEEIESKVLDVLQSLGLESRKDLKVGSVLNKKISGGQRKRLNIALELIREPAVMFVDEPTSGLSSRDSENVIDLLKELSLKGKLIFVVIHQPSSDIFKMFDKTFLLDTGGYPIFYGDPVESVMYFKKAAHQVGSDRGQCMTCGNVNAEILFNIIEAQVVDEYGEFTNKRKVSPEEWQALYEENFTVEHIPEEQEAPPKNLKIPNKFNQTRIFTTRDFLSKISNTQYLLINLLEAPILAFFLSFIIRYRNGEDGEYIYSHNDNIPAYVLICVIIALFMGLTVSAEEIIRDRKILKREAFLNLSRTSYLFSKLIILFGLSAIQSFTFVLIGNFILDIEGLNMMYWLVLFSTSCFANILGLNISSAFNSAITVYILIPLLLIPQMILSGLIFDFSKLNNSFSTPGKVPIIADFMASRWAYEAVVVEQFKGNPYEARIFDQDVIISTNSYKESWHEKLEGSLITAKDILLYDLKDKTDKKEVDSLKAVVAEQLELVRLEILDEPLYKTGKMKFDVNTIKMESVNEAAIANARKYLTSVIDVYNKQSVAASEKKSEIIHKLKKELAANGQSFKAFQNRYHNNYLETLLKARNPDTDPVIVDHNRNRLVRQVEPIFYEHEPSSNPLNYRAHFYSPVKYMFGIKFSTFTFNISVIWFFTLVLYFTLYFDVLKKFVDRMSYVNFGGLKGSKKDKDEEEVEEAEKKKA